MKTPEEIMLELIGYFEQQIRIDCNLIVKRTGEEAYLDAIDVCNQALHGVQVYTPHVCPVCNGKQTVPAGFYSKLDNTSTADEPCRSCDNGIVWDGKEIK